MRLRDKAGNLHPVAQLLRWATTGNAITPAALAEAGVPAEMHGAVTAAVADPAQRWADGDQAGARDAADAAASALLDRIGSVVRDPDSRREPLPDDPRALAALVRGER